MADTENGIPLWRGNVHRSEGYLRHSFTYNIPQHFYATSYLGRHITDHATDSAAGGRSSATSPMFLSCDSSRRRSHVAVTALLHRPDIWNSLSGRVVDSLVFVSTPDVC